MRSGALQLTTSISRHMRAHVPCLLDEVVGEHGVVSLRRGVHGIEDGLREGLGHLVDLHIHAIDRLHTLQDLHERGERGGKNSEF